MKCPTNPTALLATWVMTTRMVGALPKGTRLRFVGFSVWGEKNCICNFPNSDIQVHLHWKDIKHAMPPPESCKHCLLHCFNSSQNSHA